MRRAMLLKTGCSLVQHIPNYSIFSARVRRTHEIADRADTFRADRQPQNARVLHELRVPRDTCDTAVRGRPGPGEPPEIGGAAC
eukprot:9085259-Pyramimonas_sp.AAC.1